MEGYYDLNYACECGTTLKISSLSQLELDFYQRQWEATHLLKGHEAVTPLEANKIRYNERQRRRVAQAQNS